MRRHVFITGIARSGTTLLANLLNAQRNVTVWSNVLSGPLNAAQRLGGFERVLSARERNIALSWVDHELQGSRLRVQLGPTDFANVRGLYSLLLEQLAAPGDQLVGHKVNGFGPHTPAFWWLLEQTSVCVVCVVRDIRDVILSQQNHLHAGHASWDSWRSVAQRAPELRAHPRCVLLKFEDLVRSPASALTQLEARLGIAIETQLEVLRHIDQPWVENSAFHDVQRLFDLRAVERWRSHLDNPLVREAAYFCADELRDLGYPAADISWSWREHAHFVRERMVATQRRARRRIMHRFTSLTARR